MQTEKLTKLDEFLDGNFTALQGDAYVAYADNLGLDINEVEDWSDECESAFIGQYDDRVEMVEALIDEGVIDLSGIPEHLSYYFDSEKYARDFMIGDAWEVGGFYFWNR